VRLQAEPRAALCLASREASHLLKLAPTDLLLYSAKIIPGNDTKVMSMMNNVSALGVEIAMGASEGLHTSGHAYRCVSVLLVSSSCMERCKLRGHEFGDAVLYVCTLYSSSAFPSPCKLEGNASNSTKSTVDQLSYASCRDELEEVMKLVKPQHFLPVHGEYSFLTAHAQLAKDVGIKNTSVIRNGQMLGVHHRRNANEVSTTGASVKGMQLLGDVKLRMLYNDGNKVCCDTLTCF